MTIMSTPPSFVRGSSRGLSASTQYAVIFPLLLLSTFGVIQGGVFLHARNVAAEAARAAADVARSTGGDQQRAHAAASEVADVGGLTDVTVTVVRTPTRVQARVTAQAPLILDIGLGVVTESADAPMERVTDP
jgi:Flp pilus assembly protein TadG